MYSFIAVSWAIGALALGFTWIEVVGAFAIAVAVGVGSKAMHVLIERKTHRSSDPRTDRQSATLFAVGLGGAMLVAFFAHDLHRLVSFAGICIFFFIGDMLGHVLFGVRETDESVKVMED